MKTVLQINVINETSSTGRTTKELGDFLTKKGYESVIAVAIGEKNKNTYIIGNQLDHKIHALLSRVFGAQGHFSKIATLKLLFYIKKKKPDIVHLRNMHGNYISLHMLLKFLAKNNVPTVITLHDCWFYTGKCCHYTTVGCEKWKELCGPCPKLKDDNVSLFFDRTRKLQQEKKELFNKIKYLSVVGVSDWITNEAKMSSIFATTQNISRIYNWIDIQKFKPTKYEILEEQLGLKQKFVLLSVASGWSKKKGLDKIFDLSRSLPEDVVIVLVGECQEKEVPDNIILCGTVSNVDMLPQYYSMADLYLNLSLEESFGKVSAEAIACGTPVIAINSTANGEVVGENCGFVLEKYDKNDVLECIKTVKRNKKKIYSQSCVNWARMNFSMKNNAQQYIELYNNLIRMKEKR